jgi:predicted dehydrogenase
LTDVIQRPIRFAYVGCGFVAQNIHIPNFASLPGCEFVGLAEAREGLGQQVARRYGIPRTYRSHEEVAADPDIDAVGVSAPYVLQGRIAEDLLRAGKQVFMEKPMAVSLARAEAMIGASRAGGGRLMVGYMKRYDTGNLLIKARMQQWLDSGDRGRVLLARNHGFGGNWVYARDPNIPFATSAEPAPPAPADAPSWLPARWREPYLGYLQQWTHNINLLRFFLGDTEQSTARVESVQLDQDGMTGIVVFDMGGVRAVVESAYTRFHAWEEHTQIYFEGGWLRTQAPPLMQKEVPATVEVYEAGMDGQPPRLTQEFAPPGWAYREEAKHFIHCVQAGEPFRSSAEDTVNDVRLIESIYREFLGIGGDE